MGFITQDRVTYIVIMRYLDVIKQYHIFQFRRISHHGMFPHDGTAANKRTVTDLSFFINDHRTMDICRRCHYCTSGDPYILAPPLKLVVRQFLSQLNDKITDQRQNLKRICLSLKNPGCDRFRPVK